MCPRFLFRPDNAPDPYSDLHYAWILPVLPFDDLSSNLNINSGTDSISNELEYDQDVEDLASTMLFNTRDEEEGTDELAGTAGC